MTSAGKGGTGPSRFFCCWQLPGRELATCVPGRGLWTAWWGKGLAQPLLNVRGKTGTAGIGWGGSRRQQSQVPPWFQGVRLTNGIEEIPKMEPLGLVFKEKRFSDLGVLFHCLIRGEIGMPILYGRGGEENG